MYKPLILCLTVWLALTACGPAPTEPSAPTQTAAPAETAATPDNSHNSANSLDWAGVYKGVVPCADCEGIETLLTLNMDSSYQLSTTYLGKDSKAFEQQGRFEWNAKGSVIRLLEQKDGPALYKVVENQLIQLDMAGQLITGDLADNYKLNKQSAVAEHKLTGVRWKLTELMGQAVPATEPDMTPYLEFGDDGRVSGFAGCNQFTGAYETEGLRLTFKPMATTQKACLNASVEQQFLTTIQGIDNYSLNDSGLAFYKARTAALLRFIALQP
ncbi:MAG: copper resistance protein NlpE N-terminal domain-containing protein [Gammaproteobacteria bacterium]|nr:copper resistance protein NlpE N-terminal domain-containing protein [Gammaproteobacteria bacterium]